MYTEFRRARVPEEIRSLVIFDHKAFHEYPDDYFDAATWSLIEAWWMIVDHRKVGCCALQPDMNFLENDVKNASLRGSLYIASTGILPDCRRRGLGALLKCWQISYARQHGFRRIVTNTRKSNLAMIALNRKFGFEVIRTSPNYYQNPREATVVMELRLGTSFRSAFRLASKGD